ncbi:hypothetical protein PR202_ga19838 [Eleusine coracana subsp. coracana]|uniref:B box-type domain-containing protein n=1 Tax=Eleusine coracana subsp. coracana TaxID=191504 RepID=A0AAV5CX63_ELECO|nr:hypothetical protein PR202_ga19838 [Eleusine coracana subsp. coracana]
MRIQCDACGAAAASVVCCADEAALCARCDVEIHAANKLAGKHQRLPLAADSSGSAPPLPRCDVCQERPAFIFCVEDRALLCRDCDEPIHVPGTLSANHTRFLATGIRKDSPPLEFKELEWFADIDLFHGHAPPPNAAAEVPELFASPHTPTDAAFYKAAGGARQSKKPRLELPDDDEDYFIVPDLG